jgi:hypothetical protein
MPARLAGIERTAYALRPSAPGEAVLDLRHPFLTGFEDRHEQGKGRHCCRKLRRQWRARYLSGVIAWSTANPTIPRSTRIRS